MVQDYRNPYKKQQMYQQQNQDWLAKMKADRQAGTGAYAIQQGGPNVAQYPNVYQNPSQNRFTRSSPSQPDPYQLQQKPTLTNQASGQPPMMYPGQNQISTVGNVGPNAGPRPQQPPTLSNQQGPSTQPGGSPWFRPVNNQPGKGIGPGGPTVFNQNFANTPYGQSQMPYQPRRTQFQPPQNSIWGY